MKLKGRRSRNNKLDFEINIVPIIDCLTILLTFMLASGAFISLGVLEIGVAGPSAEASQAKPPEIDLTIRLLQSEEIILTVTGKQRRTQKFAPVEGHWNYAELAKNLGQFKEQFPEVRAVTLESQEDIAYQDIVKTMEVAKRSHPDVLLGGF